ncbi:alpha/beta hydrolase [Alkalimonas sp.]|uniref:alpha/beta hydrolase n=1 Tax=Alkalimonas sp. TaxID=1872453 RepID=UPI00263AA231|nr:alpha/beta hydrolase [Alkalimonas sp.]MCC5827394.1 alpha/beta hydrolase [Alkalimonas sp.]
MHSMTTPLVVFSHGKETGPNGRKINTLREIAHSAGAQTISVDYTSTIDPALRVQLLLDTVLPAHHGLILVGSSMGGYVSTVASRTLEPDALLLMAPAFGLKDYPEPYPAPSADSIAAVHGWHDEVVPVENAIHWAKLSQAKLVLVDDDHSLHKEVATVGELLIKMIAQIKAG